MSSCPLVMIQWEDSAQPISSWSYLSDFEPKPVIRCASVGWLIHDGEDVKSLAPNMGGLENENNMQVSGIIQIPARCIISVHNLEEPDIIFCPFSRPDPEPKRLKF